MWLKLDVDFPDHPKVMNLSDGAFRLHVTGLCYASRYLTDGFLARPVVRRLGDIEVTGELVTSGLWEESGDGDFRIHDFLLHQSSREKVEGLKEANRTRVAKFREKHESPKLLEVASVRIESADFEEWWKVYPRKASKGTARKAYDKARGKVPRETLLEAALKYRNDPNRTEQFTAYGASWLNAEGWLDEPLPAQGDGRGKIATVTPTPPRYEPTRERKVRTEPLPPDVAEARRLLEENRKKAKYEDS